MDSSVVAQVGTSSAVAPMGTQQPRRRIPKVQFRVLIIGRANAGKTSILQRVCETTESPVVYQRKLGGKKKKTEEVRGPNVMSASLISLPTRLNLSRPWMLVSIILLFGRSLNKELARRAHH
jgi:GTPase SAR1 family protein